MPVIKHGDVKEVKIEAEGLKGVTKKVPVGKEAGWKDYTMRVFTIAPGGYTFKHKHDWEHINHVVSGRGKLMLEGVEHEVGEKDFAFVPPNTLHQFSNPYDKPFEFICIVPNKGEY